jgi:hypothetical protein
MSDNDSFVQDRPRNPFSNGSTEVATRPVATLGALASAEQQRALGELQAQIMLARMNPRDPIQAVDNILRDCGRVSLAQAAQYEYARGGTDIRGPSIKLMEAIARRWGNIHSGFKVIHSENSVSEVITYAWDLETGYKDERQFQVPHIRDTRRGPVKLTDERDIYELIANNSQRRKRACLIAVIPSDVIEAAIEQCNDTLGANVDTSVAGLKKLLAAFAEFGVTQVQIEQRIQCKLEAISPGQVIQLSRIYTSLKDGMSQPSQWFRAADPPRQQPPKPQQTQPVQPPPKPPETPPIQEKDWELGAFPLVPEQPAGVTTAVVGETSREQVPDTLSGSEEPELFSYMILGEDGEPIDGEEYLDPLAWAQALLAALASSDDRAMMLMNNATALAEAKALSPEADALLDGITLPDQPEAPEPEPHPLVETQPPDPEELLAAEILQRLPTLKTVAEVIAYSKSPAVSGVIARWKRERPAMVTSVSAAFQTRLDGLRASGA